MAFLFVTALGSYETYQYTESVGFCGKTCHLPMTPQFVAYQHTAHASVECVACHVGPGAAAYFKTKLNGVKQLYHTVRNDFDRPIYLPTDMRPAQAICEQCHWPKKYVGNVDRTFQHYLSDEKNTPFAVRLLLNVGGGDPSNGPVGGIHWHMNIAQQDRIHRHRRAASENSVGENDECARSDDRISRSGFQRRSRPNIKFGEWIAWIATAGPPTRCTRQTRRLIWR